MYRIHIVFFPFPHHTDNASLFLFLDGQITIKSVYYDCDNKSRQTIEK